MTVFAQKNADLIITNAKIYTVNRHSDVAESMAVSDGKIIAVGKNKDILKKFTSKNIQNLYGKAVFPGFIDAHCHFTGYATDKW
ncbi:MAG: amidohydrolase, partial [Kaistella sp.]